ncbi:hypothetical protein N7456_005047 [Penicillium angulare]|uniref:Uncharacterized protein n=1 Tax=Penicillium angulare TaxID=116970 RepID=A0A9W9FXS1_9EURO|nr:hypothetical protein N7456_005047 [Penicillium angulare]
MAQDCGNQCRLLLRFGIGHGHGHGVNDYARRSNGLLLGPSSNPPLLTDEADELYQIICYSGLLPGWGHGQFLDKILTSWAKRVAWGDWVVKEDGVSGGIEKFKEANTYSLKEVLYSNVLVMI